jgi:hypothetical protein
LAVAHDANMTRDPRLRVLYLIAVGAGIFLAPKGWPLLAVLAFQLVLWLAVGLPLRQLVRQITKLWLFAAFVLFTFAFFAAEDGANQWIELPILGVPFNLAGMKEGAFMLARVITVILASHVVRAGDPRAIVSGLQKLRAPRIVSLSLDTLLALMSLEEGGGGGRGRGRGGGSGGGRGMGGGRGRRRRADDDPSEPPPGFWQALKKLARGDIEPLLAPVERHIARAEDHLQTHEGSSSLRRDVAVIAGVSAAMMGFKVLKILPAIPFAPGYKLVVFTPLYVVAALMTRTRAGATLAGLCMGVIAFLMGDGRYGIFEILKHIAPGVICDLGVLVLVRTGRSPGPLSWTVLCGLMGVGRVATIFAVTLALKPPAMAYALLLPNLVVQVTFSAMSGWISYHLVRAVEHLRAARRVADVDERTEEAEAIT